MPKASRKRATERPDPPTVAPIPRVSLTPIEAAASAGVSRVRIFDALRDGRLVGRKDGKAVLIEIGELTRWVASMPKRWSRKERAAA